MGKLYHDIITLLKTYCSVNWRMQAKIGQVKIRFQAEYGSDVDELLNRIHEAGMDLNDDDLPVAKPSVLRVADTKISYPAHRFYLLILPHPRLTAN